jgi:hypothetical protein
MAGQAKFSFIPQGIAIPEDTLLLNWVQNHMILLESSGALKAIGKRWFKDTPWIKEPP